MYQPHNFYVIHIDKGAPEELRKVRAIAVSCGPCFFLYDELILSLTHPPTQRVKEIIDATPFADLLTAEATKAHASSFLPKDVWGNIDLIEHKDSVNALWGDVTLVYLEVRLRD